MLKTKINNPSNELREDLKYDFPPITISVVIPAHNEEEGIAHTIEVISKILQANSLKYEIIVVDDGSKDLTYHEVINIANQRKEVKGILLSRNFGKEAALLAGLTASKGDVVITIDADLQHPPKFIPEMIKRWQEGAKIVHARKRNRTSDSLLIRWRASVFNTLLSKIAGIDIRNSSDFKLLDRLVVEIIVNQLKESRRFYRGLTDWVGFKQSEILFDVELRKDGKSKWSIFSLVDLATTAIVSFTSAPLRIISFLGLITLLFAVVVAIDTLWSWYRGVSVSGFATLEITILFVGSLIMISLGIAGEYIAKIYDESKQRPPFLVSASCGFDDNSCLYK